MDSKIKNELIQMFESHFNEKMTSFEALPSSGSYREYYRIKSNHYAAMGTWNADVKENMAFLYFSEYFLKQGITVPQIYCVNETKDCYLQEDLGSTTLFGYLSEVREKEGFSDKIVNIYKKVLDELPKIQIIAGQGISYDHCHPRAAFDKQSMMWDMNYFKYYFLKLAKVPFNEQDLEDDFENFTNYLLSTDTNYFLFRDFQSRNIMLRNDNVTFIDYQGGREGALQYDIASLLYDAKADIPIEIRTELLDYYLDVLDKYIHGLDRDKFKSYFTGYALIRIMQAMGAYGFRGFYEKKEHFLKSIPYALENMKYLLKNCDIPEKFPELFKVLEAVTKSEYLQKIGQPHNMLTVRVTSFSFRKGLPEDPSGNGGGFIFDCRSIHNPGRYDEYKLLTGRDKPVIDFFNKEAEMDEFLGHAFALVEKSVDTYLKRGFNSLSVNFGCTGGQHRSVFAAESMASFLSKLPVNVILQHREIIY